MTLLLLLATFSIGSGQATLRFDSPEACEQMKSRLLGYAHTFQQYVPFQIQVQGYCVPE
jgi:hypothetical protein